MTPDRFRAAREALHWSVRGLAGILDVKEPSDASEKAERRGHLKALGNGSTSSPSFTRRIPRRSGTDPPLEIIEL